ncbi:hypothetical protein RBI94_26100 [Pseudomonas putida]|uniref:hypothetical protein n=1 Tax=Pseudomonas putida TaxID=303 RepID=UPI0027CB3771|nr:hypothetical protein [Pseudomonas putida]MDQ2487478.1 hypothetical protein [Pseudomonas putida]
MTTSICVSGVLGLCRVDFGYPTQAERPESLACTGAVLGVLGSSMRARVRVIFCSAIGARKNLYARTKKPNKPNTLNTNSSNQLISLSFICVGFVSGCGNVCWVLILGVLQ